MCAERRSSREGRRHLDCRLSPDLPRLGQGTRQETRAAEVAAHEAWGEWREDAAEPMLASELHRAPPGVALGPEARGRDRHDRAGTTELGELQRGPTADRVPRGMCGV